MLKIAEKVCLGICLILLAALLVIAPNGSLSETRTSPELICISPSPWPDEPGLININTADIPELESVPGIGPVLAERIVDYRREFGDFAAPADIMDVSGIGRSVFEKLKDHITV